MWCELIELKNKTDGNWIFFGDFNVVRFDHERFSSSFYKSIVADFNRYITDAGLQEFNTGGMKLTYLRDDGHKLSKTDRFLVCSNFINTQPLSLVTALSREFSDHSPLILKPFVSDFGPSPFRLFNSWLLRDDFNMIFSNAWESFRGFGAPDRFLAAKLKFVKNSIRDWRQLESSKEQATLIQLKKRWRVWSLLQNLEFYLSMNRSQDAVTNKKLLSLSDSLN